MMEAEKHEKKKRKVEKTRSGPLLSWMRHPIEISDGPSTPLTRVAGLHEDLSQALRRAGFEEFFPVQSASWQCLAGGLSQAHDLCICAPTGSGKTLAYAVPILQRLIGTVQGILGALVVLPTRELAVQVFEVFATFCPHVNLWVGLTAARTTVAAESAALREGCPSILVATPGRLMAHLTAVKPAVHLQDLSFLVIDETDRLLRQAYQNWLPYVMTHVSRREEAGHRVVKVVASATLTQNPAKLESLELFAPRYIAMSSTDSRYKVPKELKEFKVIGSAVDKSILLCAILEAFEKARTIVFTASLAANHRLFLVLKKLWDDEVVEHSGGTSQAMQQPGHGLEGFRGGERRILVTSDALTRGVDIPGVDLVINYDTPTYPKTYVHRAGRTARAGKSGTVITILSTEQVHHYKVMLRKIDNTFVKDFAVPQGAVSKWRQKVVEAMDMASTAEMEGC